MAGPKRNFFVPIAAAAVVTAAILGGFWWRSHSRTAAFDNFRYLPAGAPVAVAIDLEGFRRTALVRLALLSQAAPELDRAYAEFVRETGFNWEKDLDSLAASVGGAHGSEANGRRDISAVLQGHFDQARFTAYSEKRRDQAESYRGRTISSYTGPSGRRFHTVFLDDRRLAFSNAAHAGTIHRIIDLADRQPGATLHERLNQIGLPGHLAANTQAWVAFDWAMARASTDGGPAGVNPAPGGGAPGELRPELLKGSRIAVLGARIVGASVEFRALAAFGTDAEARRFADTLSTLRILLAEVSRQRGSPASRDLAGVLDRLSIGTEREAVVVGVTVEMDVIEQLLSGAADAT